MKKMKVLVDPYLLGILILAIFLYSWGIWDAGEANSYYTAAVTSMVQSWHNFFYGAFDPAGFITVDKPPIALWFMAISAKIFGVYGWSVVLPSVLFGVGSVYLIYRLVKHPFGELAGKLAALTMTLSPIVVANSRTNNMDATLVFFLLLATFYLFKASQLQKQRYLLLSFALIGISFNIKMLQAFMILPALYLFYFLASRNNWKKKFLHAGMATGVLAFFTLLYPLAVDHVPASIRPYIGSSQTNSLLELAFGYNGTERLLGQSTGTGGAFPGMGKNSKQGAPAGGGQKNGTAPPEQLSNKGKTETKAGFPGNTPPLKSGSKSTTSRKMLAQTATNKPQPQKLGQGKKGRPEGKGGGMGGGAFNIGTAGPLRLFQSELGPQISWLLPIALISLIAGFWITRKRKSKWYQTSVKQNHFIFWGTWLAAGGVFFSIASFFHPYYLIMLAPPLAASVGIGIAYLFKKIKNQTFDRTDQVLSSTAILSTAALQTYYLLAYSKLLAGLLLGGTGLLLLLTWLPMFKSQLKRVMLVSLVLLFTAPTFWSLTPTLAHQSAAIPTSGPELLTQGGGGFGMGSQIDPGLLAYLKKHQRNATYLFATTDANSAASYIIRSKKAVMATGGYNGTDPAITLKRFKQLVKQGKITYFYSSGRGSQAITNWVEKHGTKIDSSVYSSHTAQGGNMPMGGGMGGTSTLYHLTTNSDS